MFFLACLQALLRHACIHGSFRQFVPMVMARVGCRKPPYHRKITLLLGCGPCGFDCDLWRRRPTASNLGSHQRSGHPFFRLAWICGAKRREYSHMMCGWCCPRCPSVPYLAWVRASKAVQGKGRPRMERGRGVYIHAWGMADVVIAVAM